MKDMPETKTRAIKEPRAIAGKVRKHHWFKSARVLLRMAIEQRHSETERKRLRESHCVQMFDSIRDLFRRGR